MISNCTGATLLVFTVHVVFPVGCFGVLSNEVVICTYICSVPQKESCPYNDKAM